MRSKKKILWKKNYHKNRQNPNCIQPILKFGSLGICTFHNISVELKLFKFFKKIMKLRKKRYKWKKKIWQFLTINHPISKKSTNSRMGKGKGTIYRWKIKIRSGTILFELKGISAVRMQKILIQLNKRLSHDLKLLIKKNSFY